MFNLELKEQEVNVVLQALQELPYRVSRDVIENIMRQAQSQVVAQAPSASPEIQEELED